VTLGQASPGEPRLYDARRRADWPTCFDDGVADAGEGAVARGAERYADEAELVAAARAGDEAAYERLVRDHRRQLLAHCYRMLGSTHDAEDALQETLVNAWRGLDGFEGRSSVRSWLYRIATNACLRQISRRPRRLLTPDYTGARHDTADLGEIVTGPVWLEPWPDELVADDVEAGPEARYVRKESVELAFVAALQHLPGTQRAVLVMRDVLAFSAAETAQVLDTSAVSVNSALQRARKSLEQRVPGPSQDVERGVLGNDGEQQLVEAFVDAWERADLDALLGLLRGDATFTMPPLPAWFDGRADVGRFLAERVFETSWRLRPLEVNGQLGFACYLEQNGESGFTLGAINVVSLRAGAIASITGFLDPRSHEPFRLPQQLASEIPRSDR
jgi:RNA polymerase sigma-70 factor (TIGR02960 family)